MNNFFLNESLKNKLTILLYHGVSKEKEEGIINYQGKHISDNDFYDQMEFIKKYCSPLSMNEWIEISSSGNKIPLYPTVITFDDGFKNNFEVASPILQDLSVPSTFYISSGMIDSDLIFWVDIVEQCIHLTDKTYINLDLKEKKEFKLGSIKEKISALLEIKKWCKSQKDSEKERVISKLIQQTEVTPKKDKHPNYQTLTWNNVRSLNDDDLFTIGGHTVSHTILPSLPEDELNYQITECIEEISKQLSMTVQHFSYPEGQSNHFNDTVIEILKREKIICCPTAIHGYNDFNEDLFHLKRVMVGFEGVAFPHANVN